jgi:sec-independent protein translocase protein TatB
VFGLSFGEMVMVIGVAMVVLGPKELPRYLRKAGQFAGRLRRLAFDMREKSGIDEVLRSEGLDRDIAEIRRLTRSELTGILTAARTVPNALRLDSPPQPVAHVAPVPVHYVPPPRFGLSTWADHEREYPIEGADSYGALPETADVYVDSSVDGSPPADVVVSPPLDAASPPIVSPPLDAGPPPIVSPPLDAGPPPIVSPPLDASSPPADVALLSTPTPGVAMSTHSDDPLFAEGGERAPTPVGVVEVPS